MDLNKILSLAVGLIVFILVFIFIARQFSGTKNTQTISTYKITPTATIAPSPTKPPGSKNSFDFFSWFRQLSDTTPNPTPTKNKTIPQGGTITKIRVYAPQNTPTTTPTPTTDNTPSQYDTERLNKAIVYTKPVVPTESSSYVVVREPPKEIPKTGLPTEIIPLLFSATIGGFYLRRKSAS